MLKQYAKGVLIALPVWLFSCNTQAQEEGDWLLRVGQVYADLGWRGDTNIADVDVISGPSIGRDDKPGLTLGYMFRDNWGVELLASVPLEHHFGMGFGRVRGADPGFLGGGSFKQVPLTVSTLWYPFGGRDRKFQPFIGAGISYRVVWDEQIDDRLEATLGRVAQPITGTDEPLPSNLDVNDGWGLSGRIGFDYLFGKRWGINASYWFIDSDTNATVESELGNTDLNFTDDTNILMLGVSFKF